MIRLGKLFLFAIFSFVDVQVKAEVLNLPLETDPVQQPAGCLKTPKTCAVKSHKNHKYEVVFHSNSFTLGSDTGVALNDDGTVTLLGGRILLEADEDVDVKTVSGVIHFGKSRSLVDFTSDGHVRVRVLDGDVVLEPIGRSEKFSIHAGLENWMGLVTSDGRVATGLPKASRIQEVSTDWAQLTLDTKANFLADFKEYLAVQGPAIEESTTLLKQTAEREIASAEATLRHRQAMARQRRLEELQIKRLFWEKTFEISPPASVRSAK